MMTFRNSYEYVISNPLKWLDPKGLQEEGVDIDFSDPTEGRWSGKDVQINIDESNCVVRLTFSVQVFFEKGPSGASWTDARKVDFKNNLKSQIEAAFNGSGVLIKPDRPCWIGREGIFFWVECCPCPDGFTPEIEIELVPEGASTTDEFWEVDVAANPSGNYIQSSNLNVFNWGELDEADQNMRPDISQVPVVHEFGHALGLDHPGDGLGFWGWWNDVDPYGHVGVDKDENPVNGPRDLMGLGMGMQPFYFEKWGDALRSKWPNCNYKEE